MQDSNGLYYYPDPSDTKTKMYVREGATDVEFRLWRHDHPQVWEKHTWLPYSFIEASAKAYRERENRSDPLSLYDIRVARALLKK